jgi:hypothetical protein
MAFVAAIAITVIVVLTWGTAGFSSNRARNVKYAERVKIIQEQDVAEIHLAHPEIVKHTRLDRHIWFLVPHLCVLFYTFCILSGAELTSNVIALGDSARYTMATGFLVGVLLVLCGAAMGSKIFGWTVKFDVSDHITAKWLGDDIVLPYRIEMAGMGAMSVSSSLYSFTSFGSTSGSLGGWLTGGIAVASILSIMQWSNAIGLFQKWDHTLISEAEARLEEAGDGDAG